MVDLFLFFCLLIMYSKFRVGLGSAADDDDDGKTASKHSRVRSNDRGGTGSVKEDSSRSALSASASVSVSSSSSSGSGGRVEGVFVVLATVVDTWRPIAGIADGENGCSMVPAHTTRLPPAVSSSDSSVGNFLTDLRTQ
jgi:hypothetical protein